MQDSLVLGYFDGIHLAHQEVIHTVTNLKDSNIILVTLKNFTKSIELIYSRENSYNKLKSLGVNEIIELDFNKISTLSANDFVEFLYNEFSPYSISTGFNYTFGINKTGSTKLLKDLQNKYNYKYFCVDETKINNELVSSTNIKNMLRHGEIKKANSFLGSNFILEGYVKKGLQLARQLGYPTANFEYPTEIVKIPYGVYKIKYKNNLGILNWGIKPTIDKNLSPILEVHIFDFDEDIYNKFIQIEVLDKIREEIKFNNLDELKNQINKDIQKCLK